ncbi:MAG: hypothetical protein ACTSWN_04475 [Promethearchaeota archaeon]
MSFNYRLVPWLSRSRIACRFSRRDGLKLVASKHLSLNNNYNIKDLKGYLFKIAGLPSFIMRL